METVKRAWDMAPRSKKVSFEIPHSGTFALTSDLPLRPILAPQPQTKLLL
jgi:hypothetical protein